MANIDTLLTVKEDIRQAINTLNGSEIVTNSMPFNTWADYVKIRIPPLSEASFDIINEVSLSGKASEYWSTGDSFDTEVIIPGSSGIADSELITFEIVGFGHDDLADGSGKAGITFGMRDLMANTRRMNSSNTNAGSYVGSAMNNFVSNDFFNGLPADLQTIIKSIKKVTGNSDGSSSWSETRTDNFKTWLFSEAEVFGTKTNSVGNEGSKYARFTSNSLRTKKLSNGSGSANYWWLRSPSFGDNYTFCVVSGNGDTSSSSASYSNGVCVGFCV